MTNIEEFFRWLASKCHTTAMSKGFYNNEETLKKLNEESIISDELYDALITKLAIHRHGLISSEVGELTEAVRKPRMGDHVPTYTQEEEEFADTIIRLFDYAGWRNLDTSVILAKMEYNEGRPFMHGKKA